MGKGRRGIFSSKEPTSTHDDTSEYKDAYSNLNKSALVQESNIFNDKTLKEKKMKGEELYRMCDVDNNKIVNLKELED